MCLSRKVGKRFPEGRVSGAAERQRDVKDIEAAKTPGEGLPSRHAPGRGCLRQQTGVEKAALAQQAQGFRGYALESAHQSTGAVVGLCVSKVGKRLERRRGFGDMPRKYSASDETRTHTDIAVQGILSPSCLPFHHQGIFAKIRKKPRSRFDLC